MQPLNIVNRFKHEFHVDENTPSLNFYRGHPVVVMLYNALQLKGRQIQLIIEVPGGAKRTHVFQIIVTLFIFNIKKLCQHQNNL